MAERRIPIEGEFDCTPSLEALAIRQGVHPVENLEGILGPCHADAQESVDDFLSLLREWRNEGK